VSAATVLPEDLGNYEPQPFFIFTPHSVADVLNDADNDHPFYGVTPLQQIVDVLRARGWTFAAPTQVAGLTP